ncbi:MAG: FtsW/RodA/SpoVE family cell cycle protein, partial [Oscillospiraceae bacterium]|nr:FtsW/RodA/SpoVE family cell cycle protein [Oscillospiraceae bacterium]
YLILQLVRVALDADDLYGGMIVSGIALHLSCQTIINVAVALNVFPNTGVSLPFISYGGSSMMIMLGEIGVVLSVRRRRVIKDFKKQYKRQRMGIRS